eukprot:4044737-Prymnesium_polylepis.1
MPFYARVPRRATGARPARPRPMTRGKQFACAGQTFGLPGRHVGQSRANISASPGQTALPLP